MDAHDIVLTGLAPAKGAFFSPVQVQKLFFLLDKKIPEQIGGPIFNFVPYNYGPFDKAVYDTLEELSNEALVDIGRGINWSTYRLTVEGQKRGEKLLRSLPPKVSSYITQISKFVLSLSFTELVRAIYKAYPDMRANSVFQER